MFKDLVFENGEIDINIILNYLKDCNENNVVDGRNFIRYGYLTYISDNDDYDPDNFSQEIENSGIDCLKLYEEIASKNELFKKKVRYIDFANCVNNSDVWKDNHSKICKTKIYCGLYLVAEADESGIYTFNTPTNIDKIMTWCNENKDRKIYVLGI